jgi:integrase
MRGDGYPYQRHRAGCPNEGQREAQQKCTCVWWVRFSYRGKDIREGSWPSEREARRKLRTRIKAIRGDRYVGPAEEKLSVGDLLDALAVHLEVRGASLRSAAPHIKAARAHFGMERAVDLTAARIERYQQEELAAAQPKAPATINRVVGTLRQAFRLARKQERLGRMPVFPMLPEQNVRQGFVDPAAFDRLAAALPPDLADAARMAYATGWRKGQLAALRWEHVDRTNKLIMVPGTITKNGKPQALPLEGQLWALVEHRWQRREVRRKGRPVYLSPFVFHRGDGKALGDFRKKWAKACAAAKVPPALLFHDLRRSGVRNMVRAGVDRDVAKSISGHKTDSMFSRYNITDERDQREALRRLDLYVAGRGNPTS